jgi:hypothetical protein
VWPIPVLSTQPATHLDIRDSLSSASDKRIVRPNTAPYVPLCAVDTADYRGYGHYAIGSMMPEVTFVCSSISQVFW